MTRLFEDQSLGFGNEGDLTTPPVGIGVAPVQGPNPLLAQLNANDATAGIAPPAVRAPAALAPQDDLADLSPVQRFGLGLQAFGAGIEGRPSPIDAYRKQRREDERLKVTQMKEHIDALESGNKIARTLQGEAKANFVRDYSAQLNQMRPGLGDTFSHVAVQPDILEKFDNYMPYLPESLKVMSRNNPDAFWKMISSPEGMKEIERAKGEYYQNFAAKKASTLLMGLDRLDLPPELVAQAKSGPMTASLFNKIQDALPADSPVRFSDEERKAVRKDAKLFYGSLGVMTPDTEQDVMKDKAKDKMKPGTLTDIPLGGKSYAKGAYDPDGTLFPDAKHDANGFAILGTGTKEGTTISMPSSAGFGVNPETGKPGHYTIGKNGELRWDKVEPLPKDKKPNLLKDILNPEGGAPNPAAPKPAAAAPAAAPALPPAIASKLKAGVNTTLSDGSVWTLEGGKPKQVKSGAADRFKSDPAMKGKKLGEKTSDGHEVMDPDGTLLGYYV